MADSKGDSIIGGHFATKALENPLWNYACQVYSKAGVETALLVLQDNQGADINIILQALWLASEGREWTKACISNDYAKWMEEHVLPLRQMRRSMKTDWSQYEDFRQRVKKLELNAEQYALELLFQQAERGENNADKESEKKITKKEGLAPEVALLKNLDMLGQETSIVFDSFEKLITPLFTLKL